MAFTNQQKQLAANQEARSLSRFSALFIWAYRYRVLRRFCRSAATGLEGGLFHSKTLRRILLKHHGVSVGPYSYGTCLNPGQMPWGTTIGAYCSFATGIRIHRTNHPSETLSQHPFFYNDNLGLIPERIVKNEDNPLTIGSDVWIGDNVIILPRCQSIGNGAMIGAGSIVTRDVEPYTIMTGAPAKLLKRRYAPEIEALVVDSRWWELPLPELLEAGDLLIETLDIEALRCFSEKLKH